MADSRIVAGLLLDGASRADWRHAIVTENCLQMRSRQAATKIANVLRSRLQLMEPPLWEMVRDGSYRLAQQACFAAAIKRSRLLGDYVDLTVRDLYHQFAPRLTTADWHDYLEDCRGRDPVMPLWSACTIQALRRIVHGMLAQIGYVDDPKTLRLQAVHIDRMLLRYLEGEGERYVVRCITVRPP